MHPLKIRLLHAALDCAEVLDQEEMKTIIRICLNEKSSSQQLVCDLNPSVRLRSILEREKIATVGELSQKTESELLKIRGFGPHVLREVRTILSK